MEITWGKVTSTSPLQATFAGDSSATTLAVRNEDYTPAVNDKVLLVKVGVQWVAVCSMGAA